jgi:Domain of unknown function (DUF4345)
VTVIQILKIICAIGTVATGLISLLKPRSIRGFTGLEAINSRGITEIRAVMGGLFIGLGLAPFILGAPETYQALGIMYLAIAIVRIVSMFLDKSVVQSNVISLVIEIVFGVLLVL